MPHNQQPHDPPDRGLLESLTEQLSQLFSSAPAGDDLRRNIHGILQSQLRKLDLVSREEFEAQVEVLRRSREKIDKLEQQLAELMEQQNR